VSVKKKEPKAWQPTTKEEAVGFEQTKAGLKAKTDAKPVKAYLTPDNELIYIPNNERPPKGSVPYSSGVEFSQTTPEGGETNVRVGGLPKKGSADKNMPPGQAVDLAGFKSLNDRVTTLIGKIGDPNFKDITGPLEGRWQQLKIKFVNDGPTQELTNELESLITIAYSLSGKQISEKELKMLQKAMLPRLIQPKENLLSTLNFVLKWIKLEHDNRLDYLKKSGYKTDIGSLTEAGQKTIGRFTIEEE